MDVLSSLYTPEAVDAYITSLKSAPETNRDRISKALARREELEQEIRDGFRSADGILNVRV